MRLLMITRKVDRKDTSPAGFTYTWVKKIGEKLDKLYVITWQKSNRGDLSKNIEIESLSGNKIKKVFSLWIKLLKILPKINGIFCHQNPEYTILSAPYAKLFRRRLISWYTHKAVNWKLHLVNLLTDKILTASEESCRLKNRRKIKVTGHGIDADYFSPVIASTSHLLSTGSTKQSCEKFKIISVGRISPAKDYETLIEAVSNMRNIEVEIIGGPVLKKDKEYFQNLKQLAGNVKFLGPIPHNQILSHYQNCDLFINLSQTGSVDKVVLEAMACQKLVLTCNEAFIDILDDQRLIFEKKNPRDLAKKIIDLMNLSQEEKEKIGQQLRNIVVKNHNLDKLVEKILTFYAK